MNLGNSPFQLIDWNSIPRDEHIGEKGIAYWQVFYMGAIRIRKVEYSAGYIADHWCNKGHIILCLEGEMDTELVDGRIMNLKEGMTYIVGDENEAHRTSTEKGCKLYIVD